MQGCIAPTDFDWYTTLREQRGLDEVNFWQPSGGRAFRMPAGAPFFFKLKAPHNAIGGFGRVARFSALPHWLAWECFGVANGVRTFHELDRRLRVIRRRNRMESGSEMHIGCIMVCEPVFFGEDEWVTQPRDWHPRTQSYKKYDLEQGEGQRVWLECLERLSRLTPSAELPDHVAEHAERYGSRTLVHPRLGQGTFGSRLPTRTAADVQSLRNGRSPRWRPGTSSRTPNRALTR